MALRYAPPNLHLALTMGSQLSGFDLVTPLVDDWGTIVDAEDLRFSDPEIPQFLGLSLSREELVSIVQSTEGWPFALCIYRNTLHIAETSIDSADYQETVDNYLRAELLRGLSRPARDYLLDVALCDTIQPSLLSKAFPEEHTNSWPEVSTTLKGLIRPLDGTARALRLHPMVRNTLTVRRQTEDIDRFRRVHRQLAETMAKEGKLNLAIDHAAQADDPVFCNAVIEELGGLEYFLKEGIPSFLSVSPFLGKPVTDRCPALSLVACIALLLQGQLEKSWALYERSRRAADALVSDRSVRPTRIIRAEETITQIMLWSFSCRPLNDTRLVRLIGEVARLSNADWLPPVYRGMTHATLSINDSQLARFEVSRRRGSLALENFRIAGATQAASLIDLQNGVSAMAQGRVQEAESAYARGMSHALEMARPLIVELNIERNVTEPGTARPNAAGGEARQVSAWFDIRAAAHGNLAEAAFDRGGPPAASGCLEESLESARRQNIVRLQRLLSAQWVFWQVKAGNFDAAGRIWAENDLPDDFAHLLELTGQSWRELEAVACARIALLGALGQFDAARHLAHNVRATAHGWGLKRTLMRCLATWSTLEHQASNPDGAKELLIEFLRAYRDTDYSRPLAREGEASVDVLRMLLDGRLEPDIRVHAQQLLQELGAASARDQDHAQVDFTPKDIEILKCLALGQRNKEIARSLGLTDSGVRYHLKRIYRALGATGRIHAVQRTRELGVDLAL